MQHEWRSRIALMLRGHATVFNGVTVKLICPIGKAVDKQRLVWMKGHEFVSAKPKKIRVNNKRGVMNIKDTTYSDSGVYTCLSKFSCFYTFPDVFVCILCSR